MRPEITTIVLTLLAVVLGVVAYLKDPGLPLIGARNGLAMLWLVLPRLVPGILTPGGPMVTVGFLVALANSGAAIAPLVAYMTSWSLFGMQRIIAWEAPLMGRRFVFVRVVPSLAFPVLAGWLVQVFYQD
jgi:hypothetical protein